MLCVSVLLLVIRSVGSTVDGATCEQDNSEGKKLVGISLIMSLRLTSGRLAKKMVLGYCLCFCN